MIRLSIAHRAYPNSMIDDGRRLSIIAALDIVFAHARCSRGKRKLKLMDAVLLAAAMNDTP